MDQHFRLTKLLTVTAAVVGFSFPTICFAEPILLAQLYHSRTQGEDNGHQFNFIFNVAASFERQARISRMPTSADVGQTFPADPSIVSMFHDLLAGPSPGGGVTSAFGPPGMVMQAGVDEFFNGPFMSEFPTIHVPEQRFIMKAFVPQLGPVFTGYRITGIDQTINGVSIEPQNPSRSLYWGAQTIRIFGAEIPEPSTSLLLTCALVGLARSQHRLLRSRWTS
jgi:hypothetical protein